MPRETISGETRTQREEARRGKIDSDLMWRENKRGWAAETAKFSVRSREATREINFQYHNVKDDCGASTDVRLCEYFTRSMIQLVRWRANDVNARRYERLNMHEMKEHFSGS